ncbi:MAG TPA: glutamate 5-kinase [Phycisphaerae bacterium]|nr:glutamate 5-kinase [Phycisphaerae bacterium]
MPSTAIRQNIIRNARRIVVKVGTNAICDAKGRCDTEAIARLADQISRLLAAGVEVTLVASGAIGAGMGELDLPARPRTLPQLQATAAVGQGQLMRSFHDHFARHGVKVAQVLVTRDDFENRARYLNIRNTLVALGEWKTLAILNENDAVAVDEIRFGDNDIIAAHVANLLAADLLVLLSVVDGVMDGGKVIDVIEKVDEQSLSVVSKTRSRLGSGGMGSKMTAAGMVVKAGEAAVIANARTPDVLVRLLAGEKLGTVFAPARRRLSSRRRWIGQAAKTSGRIVVDDGAARAVLEKGKSLLPSGITAVDGTFRKGDTVAVLDRQGREIARGMTNYSAAQVLKIKGLKSSQIAKALGESPYDEVIHRNNMTLR